MTHTDTHAPHDSNKSKRKQKKAVVWYNRASNLVTDCATRQLLPKRPKKLNKDRVLSKKGNKQLQGRKKKPEELVSSVASWAGWKGALGTLFFPVFVWKKSRWLR
jgi:hypothetical protein